MLKTEPCRLSTEYTPLSRILCARSRTIGAPNGVFRRKAYYKYEKTHTGLVLIFLIGAISLILILKMQNEKRIEIIIDESPYYAWDTLKPSLDSSSNFIKIQYFFTEQLEEYQGVIDLFIQTKSSLKAIIEEMNKIETQ